MEPQTSRDVAFNVVVRVRMTTLVHAAVAVRTSRELGLIVISCSMLLGPLLFLFRCSDEMRD